MFDGVAFVLCSLLVACGVVAGGWYVLPRLRTEEEEEDSEEESVWQNDR